MAVYVDNMRIAWRGKFWCHLVADTIYELHEFAASLNLPISWFHRKASHPHYDITVEVRSKAIELGAEEADRRVVLKIAKTLKLQHSKPTSLSQHTQLPLA